MTQKKQLSVDEYINALERMKKSPRDRVGILGDLGTAGLGGLAGAGVAGTVASVAGASTLLGSTTVASVLGGVIVTTTPVGWVVGSVIVGGAIGYSVSKLVRSGGKSDAVRQMNIRELSERIQELRNRVKDNDKHNDKMKEILESLQLLVKNAKVSQEDSTGLLMSIEKGNITVDSAFDIIQAFLDP